MRVALIFLLLVFAATHVGTVAATIDKHISRSFHTLQLQAFLSSSMMPVQYLMIDSR